MLGLHTGTLESMRHISDRYSGLVYTRTGPESRSEEPQKSTGTHPFHIHVQFKHQNGTTNNIGPGCLPILKEQIYYEKVHIFCNGCIGNFYAIL